MEHKVTRDKDDMQHRFFVKKKKISLRINVLFILLAWQFVQAFKIYMLNITMLILQLQA